MNRHRFLKFLTWYLNSSQVLIPVHMLSCQNTYLVSYLVIFVEILHKNLFDQAAVLQCFLEIDQKSQTTNFNCQTTSASHIFFRCRNFGASWEKLLLLSREARLNAFSIKYWATQTRNLKPNIFSHKVLESGADSRTLFWIGERPTFFWVRDRNNYLDQLSMFEFEFLSKIFSFNISNENQFENFLNTFIDWKLLNFNQKSFFH